ncbi:hypothetical protein H5T52_11100, partial [Candidatus Bipolaricaulota bacterium]|nr:hypothetical protein [Candidatus Bipolaricaulota bacterium]
AESSLSEHSHFWALGEIRRSLLGRPAIDPGRRAVIMACLGPAVYRAIRKGRIKTHAELSTLVGILEGRLEERRGLGLDPAATRRWAEWAVREALRQIEEERERREASERYLRELLREMEEARRAWEELGDGGVSFRTFLGRDNRACELEPGGEGEAALGAIELGAGLPAEVSGGGTRRASGDVERGGAGGVPLLLPTRVEESFHGSPSGKGVTSFGEAEEKPLGQGLVGP